MPNSEKFEQELATLYGPTRKESLNGHTMRTNVSSPGPTSFSACRTREYLGGPKVCDARHFASSATWGCKGHQHRSNRKWLKQRRKYENGVARNALRKQCAQGDEDWYVWATRIVPFFVTVMEIKFGFSNLNLPLMKYTIPGTRLIHIGKQKVIAKPSTIAPDCGSVATQPSSSFFSFSI